MNALLALLQLCDSQFPSGAFAHSNGLEGLLGARSDVGDDELEAIFAGLLEMQVLACDGRIGRLAHRAARDRDLAAVIELDFELLARKTTRELREASLATGRSFLAEAAAIVADPGLADWNALVQGGRSPGNHGVAFHVAAAFAGAGEVETALAYGYQAAAQSTSAVVRLGLTGHRRAQRLLAGLAPLIRRVVEESAPTDAAEASSFAPLLEIASMRHERQYSRLFRS